MAKKPDLFLSIERNATDSSVAIAAGGKLVAIALESQFAGEAGCLTLPTKALQFCLDKAGVTSDRIEVISVGKFPSFLGNLGFFSRHWGLVGRFDKGIELNGGTSPFRKWLTENGLNHAKLIRVNSSSAHLWGAKSLLPDQEMAFLHLGNVGGLVSLIFGRTSLKKGIEILAHQNFPHSLELFWLGMSQYLGFGADFTALQQAAWTAEPAYLPQMRMVIRELEPFGTKLNREAFPTAKILSFLQIRKCGGESVSFFNPKLLTSILGLTPKKLKEPFTEKHFQLASSVQARFEEVANHLLKQLHKKVGFDTVAISGELAKNPKWLGTITEKTPFKRVIVPPGNELATLTWGILNATTHAYRVPLSGEAWALSGPEYTLRAEGLSPEKLKSDSKAIDFILEKISEGKIVGHFRGNQDVATHSLGSHSLLADPRSKPSLLRLANITNRGGTPPVLLFLEEYRSEWFPKSQYVPLVAVGMETKEEYRKRATHVFTCGQKAIVQTVEKDREPGIWKLLEAFRKKTGLPFLVHYSIPQGTSPEATALLDWDYLVIGETAWAKQPARITKAA